jgi:transposase
MKRRSNSYHLEIRTIRKKPLGLLRNSYREDGKVKKETLCQITGLSLGQLQLMKASIQGKTIMKDDFKIIASREFGASHAALSIAKELELNKIIHSRYSQDWVKSALAMIVGRLVFQGSKLSLSNCSSYSALWEICGISGEIDVEVNCYDAMDKLFERQEAVQKSLAKKHLQDGTLVLYDITSCYMEGGYKDSEIVAFGYNRDKKRGHEQIVISLLCNKDGCPVAVEVFKGNTKDETTVIGKINEIRQKYDIENVIFVGDRGMVTQAVYDKIDHDTVKTITALNHSKIQELCDKGTIQMSLFDEENIVEVLDGVTRYMLCLNPLMKQKETNTRKRLLELTCAELDRIVATTRKTKYSKPVRMGRVIDKYKMAKFIIIEGSGDDVTYRLDNGKIATESALDGCYIVITDVSSNDMTTLNTVKNYKSLIKVEQAFKNLKTTRLEMRPIYHKTDDRIKCHVFICMLAYYIMWHMKQRLKPLEEIDGTGKHRKYSFDYVMESLKSIRKENVQILDSTTTVTSTPTDEQAFILNLLGVAV